MHDLHDRIDAVLDGGRATVGVESTILDISGEAPRLLRPGGLAVEEIEAFLAHGPDCLTILEATAEDALVRHLRGAGELPRGGPRPPAPARHVDRIHSPRQVKQTMTASIQYWERMASRARW